MFSCSATLYYKDVLVEEEKIGLELLETDQRSVTQEADDVLLVIYSITGDTNHQCVCTFTTKNWIFLPRLSLSISDHAKARALLRNLALLYDKEGQNESMIILSCSSRQSIFKRKSTEQVGEIQSSSSGLFTMQTLQNKTFLLKELLIILFSAASWFLTASRLCNFAFQTQIELRLWLSISNWFEIVSLYLRLNMIVTLYLRPDVSVERQWDPGEEWPLSPWPGPPPRQQERSRPSQRGKRAEVFLESRTEIFCCCL